MKLTRPIRSARVLRALIKDGQTVFFGISDPEKHVARLAQIGFQIPLEAGDSILPAGTFGKHASINANGWIEKHTDQPMETYYTQRIWRWKMKRGYSYEEAEKLVFIPRKRYPRTEHPPKGLELRITPKTDGTMLVTLPEYHVSKDDDAEIVNRINLLIEIFGEAEVFEDNLDQIIKTQIRYLNWRTLPPGKRAWKELQKEVRHILEGRPKGTQEVMDYRLMIINSYGPTFCALGERGFLGYLVFGFEEKGVYVLESLFFGNATYGLGHDWEYLSKLTKGQLIDNDLHEFRVIHDEGWERSMRARLR